MASAGEVMRCSLTEEVGGCNGLASSSGSDQQLHVLAVDDSFVDRKVIERLLKVSSCKVTTVESGIRALQYLGLDGDKSSVRFDDLKVSLIITDYSMPGMTGYELLKKIKESSAFREIPVVIMSSENILTRIDSCLEGGAEEFIVKPVKLSDVKRLKDYVTREKRTPKRKIEDDTCSISPSTSASSSPATSCDLVSSPGCDLVTSEFQCSSNFTLPKRLKL